MCYLGDIRLIFVASDVNIFEIYFCFLRDSVLKTAGLVVSFVCMLWWIELCDNVTWQSPLILCFNSTSSLGLNKARDSFQSVRISDSASSSAQDQADWLSCCLYFQFLFATMKRTQASLGNVSTPRWLFTPDPNLPTCPKWWLCMSSASGCCRTTLTVSFDFFQKNPISKEVEQSLISPEGGSRKLVFQGAFEVEVFDYPATCNLDGQSKGNHIAVLCSFSHRWGGRSPVWDPRACPGEMYPRTTVPHRAEQSGDSSNQTCYTKDNWPERTHKEEKASFKPT